MMQTFVNIVYYSAKEKKYAHHISEASWAGARIIQEQWTPYARDLYDLLIAIFSDDGKLANLDELKSSPACLMMNGRACSCIPRK